MPQKANRIEMEYPKNQF